jgi:hypothetical protein
MDVMRPASEVLGGIRDSIEEANTAFFNFFNAHDPRASDYRDEQQGIAGYFLDRAFLELKLFLEAKGILQMLRDVAADHARAAEDFMKSETTPWGEPYSFWVGHLRKYLRAVDTTFGSPSASTVTKDLLDILRESQYSITDSKCFPTLPANETDVHVRLEAVLRCVFSDLRHKPPIGKPIKNFEPDTGLPSLQTLIEYKFVATDADVKRVADEILADTRGYVSKDWDKFVYVIYETKRLKPVAQWRELLRSSGVGESTQILVISGEPVSVQPPRAKAARKGRPRKKRRAT